MSELLEALEKIPKGVNIIVFIWAMIGLCLLFRDPKIRKEKVFYVFLAMIGFMGAWRILFRIATSRYASGLILPMVVFASYFLYDSGKRRHGFVRLVLYGAITCTWFIILKMNVDSMTRNESGYVIAEVFRDIDATRGNYTFRATWKDFGRVYYASHLGDNIRTIITKELPFYVPDFQYAYTDTVMNIASKSLDANDRVLDELWNRQTQIVSLVEEDKKDKKQLIFVLSSRNRCIPVPEYRIPPYRPNLLGNGDLEELDSPEESLSKLKTHLAGHALSEDADNPVRTPRNAFFSAGPETGSFLETDVLTDSPIAGNNSVRIQGAPETMKSDFYEFKPYSPDRAAFLMFDRTFSTGDYEFSVLVKGKKGTEVCLVRENAGDGSREVRPVATVTLPDKRLFQLTAYFSADGPEDSFRVGVSVRDGEAVFDNFSLTRASGDSKAD